MGCKDQEPSSTSGPPQPPRDRPAEPYQPPEIAWEEEFAPLADSICDINPLDPSCQ